MRDGDGFRGFQIQTLALQDFAGSLIKTLKVSMLTSKIQDFRAFPEESQLMVQCSKTFRVSPCEMSESPNGSLGVRVVT